MARQTNRRDLAPVLSIAEKWIRTCLIGDRSVFVDDARWTPPLADEVYHAFVEHPDFGQDNFIVAREECRSG